MTISSQNLGNYGQVCVCVCVCVCAHHLERCKACYYQEDVMAYDGVSVQRTTSQCSCDMDWGPSIQVPAFSEISQLIRVCSLIKLLLSHSNSNIFIQTWTLERVLSLNYIIIQCVCAGGCTSNSNKLWQVIYVAQICWQMISLTCLPLGKLS